jgi:hypothetical protein
MPIARNADSSMEVRMSRPLRMPDEYAQGFVKAGQSLLQALASAPRAHNNEVVAPSHLAPPAELLLNCFPPQLAMWTPTVFSGGSREYPVIEAAPGRCVKVRAQGTP